MTNKPPKADSKGKVADEEAASQDSALPMDRFKSLARRLVNVSRQELDRQRRRQEKEKAKRPKRD